MNPRCKDFQQYGQSREMQRNMLVGGGICSDFSGDLSEYLTPE